MLVARESPTGKPVPLLVLRADPDEREALLSMGHPGSSPRAAAWVARGAAHRHTPDWKELHQLVTERLPCVAPKKLYRHAGLATKGHPRYSTSTRTEWRTNESRMGAPSLLLDVDVVNFGHHVNLDPRHVRLHSVVEPVLEVILVLPYFRYVHLAVADESHVGDESRRGQKGGRQML